ncbi:MAG: lipoyl(octanoyl) transferase LipB [Bacteroidota bacterium]
MNKKVIFENVGLLKYNEALEYQESLFNEIFSTKEKNKGAGVKHQTSNYLLLCEHPHVYTIGKSGNEANLLISDEFLTSKGASVHRVNRGGDITYHGPGQLVGYPILDLDNFKVSIKDYIYGLEEAIINVLHKYNIIASRMNGATGVWLDAGNPKKERKICAFGIRASRLVTMHGFALNVNTNLEYFGYIVPCGLVGKGVTSMQKELGGVIDVSDVQNLIKEELHSILKMEFI